MEYSICPKLNSLQKKMLWFDLPEQATALQVQLHKSILLHHLFMLLDGALSRARKMNNNCSRMNQHRMKCQRHQKDNVIMMTMMMYIARIQKLMMYMVGRTKDLLMSLWLSLCLSKDVVSNNRCLYRILRKEELSNCLQNARVERAMGSAKGRPKGTIKEHTKEKVSRDGKSGCISVWKKMEIIQEYERLKKAGTKHVESFMLRNGLMKGGYQGCLSQTKWLGSRSKYKWDVFVKLCPELAKKVLEVPNPILDVMGVAASC